MGIIGVALARNAQTARAVVLPFTCDISAAIGDLVYPDPANDFKVLVNTSNTVSQQTIGVILSKSTDTDCNVLITGVLTGYSSLTRGGKIYVSPTGTVTQTLPTTGYVQQVGIALSDEDILFSANWFRVNRV